MRYFEAPIIVTKIQERNARFIFGLKLKQLRTESALSLHELAQLSNVSPSYLNEIEKGRKYPKDEKIHAIAKALGSSYDFMVSEKLTDRLAPLQSIVSDGFLNQIPLDIFGLDFIRLGEWMGQEPSKAGTFVTTLLQIGKAHNLNKSGVYFATLRAFQELNENYFEDLEKKVEAFREEHGSGKSTVQSLECILRETYGYKIDDFDLTDYPELKAVRSVFQENKEKRLLLNPHLTERQKLFIYAKEIGYAYLKIDERADLPLVIQVDSFEHLLNNFYAAYFAGGLLIPASELGKDLDHMVQQENWDNELMLGLLAKYQISPELLFHRMSNIVPQHFGLKYLYIQRFQKNKEDDAFHITREVHLNGDHSPYANRIAQAYCRRWNGIKILEEISEKQEDTAPRIRVQRTKFHNSKNEYLVCSMARPLHPSPSAHSSISIGFAMTNTFKERVAFWDDKSIPDQLVNITCETCLIENCSDRVAEPSIALSIEKGKKVVDAIHRLRKN